MASRLSGIMGKVVGKKKGRSEPRPTQNPVPEVLEPDPSQGNQSTQGPKAPRNLWYEAMCSASLEEKQKQNFSSGQPMGWLQTKDATLGTTAEGFKDPEEKQQVSVHPVEHVIEITKKALSEYKSSDWTVKLSRGRTIDIKKKASRIISSALVMKEIINTSLEFEPTGYGAAVWMVVGFGLEVS